MNLNKPLVFPDALNEWTYAADIAGLGYNLENSIYGLYLGIRGNETSKMTFDLNRLETFIRTVVLN